MATTYFRQGKLAGGLRRSLPGLSVSSNMWTLAALAVLAVSASATSDFGQLPGERQRFRVLGPMRTYTTSQSWIEVDYGHLAGNAATVLQHLPPGAIPLAMVQGNGYGHGLDFAAKAFLDIGFKELGVTDINEAITLRQEGVEVPIHVMLQPDYLTARVAALENLEIYVEDLAFTKALCEETKAVKRESPMKVHVKVALKPMVQGVSSAEDALELIEYVGACSSLKLRGLAADYGMPQELREFARGLEQAGASIRALNMAASPHMLHSKDYELDIVRVGAALYGQQDTVPGTRSAARWLSRIATLKKVAEGDMLHDGQRAKSEMRVAVIYHGYTDAYQVDEVSVRGVLCQRVDMAHSMHVTMIDVSHVPSVEVGDLVLLHGCCDGPGGPALKKPLSLAAVSIGVPRIPKWD